MKTFPPPSPSAYYWLKLPKRLVRIALALLVLLIVFQRPLLRPVAKVLGDWLVVGQTCEKADLIIILAGDRGERLDHGFALYRRKVAPKILMSGGTAVGSANWADIMKDQAIRNGIPAEDVWTQDRSRSTDEDAKYCVEFLSAHPEIRTVCLVTSNYHSRRSLWLFKDALGKRPLVLISDPAVPDWQGQPWWNSDQGRLTIFTEYAKSLWFWVFGVSH